MSMLESKQPCGSTIDFRNAPCAGLQTLFFDKNSVKQAKMLCLTCNFRTECRELAGERGESFGVWGGINFENRREREKFLKEFRQGRK
jgi:hypothetical protein